MFDRKICLFYYQIHYQIFLIYTLFFNLSRIYNPNFHLIRNIHWYTCPYISCTLNFETRIDLTSDPLTSIYFYHFSLIPHCNIKLSMQIISPATPNVLGCKSTYMLPSSWYFNYILLGVIDDRWDLHHTIPCLSPTDYFSYFTHNLNITAIEICFNHCICYFIPSTYWPYYIIFYIVGNITGSIILLINLISTPALYHT